MSAERSDEVVVVVPAERPLPAAPLEVVSNSGAVTRRGVVGEWCRDAREVCEVWDRGDAVSPGVWRRLVGRALGLLE